MKVNAQDRPMYADLTRAATAASKIATQQTSQSTGADVVTLSPQSAIQLSNKILETELGKKLSAAFEKAGVKLSDAVGVDYSPEATAQRIADFATGMLGIFQQQHSELSGSALTDKFESTIRGAVAEGYKQAQAILGGMNLPGDATQIGKQTMDLVGKRLDDFFAQLRKAPSSQDAPLAKATAE